VPDVGHGAKRREEFHRRIRGASVHHRSYFGDGATVVVVIRVSRRLRINGSSKSSW
jgi:hypothetical protein